MKVQMHQGQKQFKTTNETTEKSRTKLDTEQYAQMCWSKTCKALSTCSGAIVLFSSLLQTSLDSDEMRFINSAKAMKVSFSNENK